MTSWTQVGSERSDTSAASCIRLMMRATRCFVDRTSSASTLCGKSPGRAPGTRSGENRLIINGAEVR